jgi:hypothetical protein
MHYSWLLDGKNVQAATLCTTIIELLRQRNFLDFQLSTARMKERGYQTEERDYIIAQRRVSSVFIYVAPAGRDLYISRATSVLTAIDIFRVIRLCVLIGIALLGPTIFPAIVAGLVFNPGSPGTSMLAGAVLASTLASIFGTVSFFIWIYVIIWLWSSIRHWIIEKDFLAYLRMRDLNDFQLDDIALLEHATDEVVLEAVKQLNLDASKIVPPASYQPARHVKVV